MKIFGFLLIVCLSHNVLMEDTTETIEPEENTTKAYDVIINDRESNDVIINENDEDLEKIEDMITVAVNESEEEDANKLLAAQVNAINVLEMIKDLEEEMKEILEEKQAEQVTSTAEAVSDEIDDAIEEEDDDDVDETDTEAEIADLQRKLAVLTKRGERVREMIVEQTRLLLGEESLLTRIRNQKVRDQVKLNTKTTSGASLTADQEEFLQDLLGLEEILKALREADKDVFRELRRRRKKRPRTNSELDKASDSILDHPTIAGVDVPDYDVPTIIVEEDVGDEVVLEYEDDVPVVVVEEAIAVPRPTRLPPGLHGHFLHPKAVRHQHQGRPRPLYPKHQHDSPYHQYYSQPQPDSLYPGHYSQPDPPYYEHYSQPQYEESYQPIPHITLTGSLLRGFENIGRGFQ